MMKLPFFSAEARINESTFRTASRVLVALMLACAAQTLASLLGQVFTDWRSWYLPVLAFLVALVCQYRYSHFKKLDPLGTQWFISFGALWLVILTVARLLVGLANGPAAFVAELSRWADEPELFLSGEFFLAAIVALITWFLADYFAELLTKLDLDYVRIQHEVPDMAENALPPVRQRLLTLTLSLGIGLVIFTALSRLDLRAAASAELVILQLTALSGGGASTLLYFMFGLALFSLSQFMDLQSRWGLQGVPVSSNLAGRWALYSLLFMAGLAVLASILPTNYSLGFLYVLGYGLSIIIQVIFFIMQLIFALFVLFINSAFTLAGQDAPLEEAPMPEPTTPEFLQIEEADPLIASATPPWAEFLRQAFFWLLLSGVVIFAVRQFINQNEELIGELRRIRFFAALADLWTRLKGFFQKASTSLSASIQQSLERLRPRTNPGTNLRNWINLRKLSPRQRIYFFYQAFLRRSSESGLPRSLSQTPSEYAQRLDDTLPEAEPDIEVLTSAFIEARYTRREIPPQSASLAQRTWERIRKVLRKSK